MGISCKVLVVDDEAIIRAYNARCLTDMGHIVVGEAGSGDEAVSRTLSLKPDVILMDISMPGIDGIEATRKIQEQCAVPIIMLTAFESEELIDRTSQSGALAYLIKPPHPLELHRTICMAVARYRDMQKIMDLTCSLKEALAEKEFIITELKDALDLIVPLEFACPSCGEPFAMPVRERTGPNEDRHDSPERDAPFRLTRREVEVLEYIRQGKSTWDISSLLRISQNTVKFHVSSILKKTNSVTRAQAVATALKHSVLK